MAITILKITANKGRTSKASRMANIHLNAEVIAWNIFFIFSHNGFEFLRRGAAVKSRVGLNRQAACPSLWKFNGGSLVIWGEC
jgi:hypothetical protein